MGDSAQMRSKIDSEFRGHARPLTEQTRDILLHSIRSGQYPDGKLPPEAELAELLGVSRTTLRAVLQDLSTAGVISRRRRHGTLINEHALHAWMQLNRLEPFHKLIEQCGYSPSADHQLHRVVKAGADEAKALELEIGADCLEVELRLLADGDPVITIVDYIPMSQLDRLPADVEGSDSTFAFVAVNCKQPVEYATTDIVPRMATAKSPAGLDIKPSTPYVELRETHFSAAGEPIAYSRVSVNDAIVRFTLVRNKI
jgi:DNA-binding GntR family transcriptional regulator